MRIEAVREPATAGFSWTVKVHVEPAARVTEAQFVVAKKSFASLIVTLVMVRVARLPDGLGATA
jgi:hypothetical protein